MKNKIAFSLMYIFLCMNLIWLAHNAIRPTGEFKGWLSVAYMVLWSGFFNTIVVNFVTATIKSRNDKTDYATIRKIALILIFITIAIETIIQGFLGGAAIVVISIPLIVCTFVVVKK